jgi:site-specific DNA-cytosine methylase
LRKVIGAKVKVSSEIKIGFLLPAAGHWLYAAQRAGLKLCWFMEPGKSEFKTCQINFPEVPGFNEVMSFGPDIGKVDVVVGSPPCAGFSVAGARFNTKPRVICDGVLDFAKTASKFKPDLILMENVSRFYSYDQGGYFNKVTSELEKAGYDVRFEFLWAKDFGSPQTRKRIFVAATRKGRSGFSFPNPNGRIGNLKSLIGDLEDAPMNPGSDHVWTKKMVYKMYGKSRNLTIPEIGSHLTIHSAGHLFHHYSGKRNLSILELKRIMGLPDDWILPFKGIGMKTKMIAEGVDIRVLNAIMTQIKIYFA